MRQRGLPGLAIMVVLGAIFFLQSAAEAKTIQMGVLSRSQVKAACARAGGHPVGIEDENSPYGCYGRAAVVQCTPDSDCQAVTRDTLPVTGNSLDLVLKGPAHSSGPTAIRPLDARVMPAVKP